MADPSGVSDAPLPQHPQGSCGLCPALSIGMESHSGSAKMTTHDCRKSSILRARSTSASVSVETSWNSW